jgi:hypothetical protein
MPEVDLKQFRGSGRDHERQKVVVQTQDLRRRGPLALND